MIADTQPIAEIMPERKAKLLTGLHQAEQAVARLATRAADGAARDLALDDDAAQIPFRGIGMERDLGSLENAQQLDLATPQPTQQRIEFAIAGADGEYPIEPKLKAAGGTSRGFSPIGFQRFVKVPDELAQGFDVLHLARRRRHQLVQQPFGMDPAQSMGADPELAGVVGDDHCIADQTMMADSTPDAGLGKRANFLPVKNVDALGGEMLEKGDLIGKMLRLRRSQSRHKGRIHLSIFQEGKGSVVEDIVLIIAAQQGQEVQP